MIRDVRGSALAWARRGAAVAFVILTAPACSDDPTGPGNGGEPEIGEVGAVVNSEERTLTVFSADDPTDSDAVDLAPEGTPVGLSVRGDRALVPMGLLNAVAVVDLRDRVRVETIALPEGSGATGSAFISDSEAVVANPDLDSVSRIDLSDGKVTGEAEVGRYPNAVLAHEDRVFVANAELDENFVPAESGTLTVLDAGDLSSIGTVELSGLNPGAMALGPEGNVHVLNSGQFGEGNGSLSVVDPGSLEEVAHHEDFGGMPGSLAFAPDGVLYVASFEYGVAAWDSGSEAFLRGPEDPITPAGASSASGLAFDSQGRLHAVVPQVPGDGQGDMEPGAVVRLDRETYEVDLEIPAGLIASGAAFSEFQED